MSSPGGVGHRRPEGGGAPRGGSRDEEGCQSHHQASPGAARRGGGAGEQGGRDPGGAGEVSGRGHHRDGAGSAARAVPRRCGPERRARGDQERRRRRGGGGGERQGAGNRRRAPPRGRRAAPRSRKASRPPARACPTSRIFPKDDVEIRVGRKSTDNDELSCDPAHRDDADWWMHASGCPGSHVVIRFTGNAPPADTVPRRGAGVRKQQGQQDREGGAYAGAVPPGLQAARRQGGARAPLGDVRGVAVTAKDVKLRDERLLGEEAPRFDIASADYIMNITRRKNRRARPLVLSSQVRGRDVLDGDAHLQVRDVRGHDRGRWRSRRRAAATRQARAGSAAKRTPPRRMEATASSSPSHTGVSRGFLLENKRDGFRGRPCVRYTAPVTRSSMSKCTPTGRPSWRRRRRDARADRTSNRAGRRDGLARESESRSSSAPTISRPSTDASSPTNTSPPVNPNRRVMNRASSDAAGSNRFTPTTPSLAASRARCPPAITARAARRARRPGRRPRTTRGGRPCRGRAGAGGRAPTRPDERSPGGRRRRDSVRHRK